MTSRNRIYYLLLLCTTCIRAIPTTVLAESEAGVLFEGMLDDTRSSIVLLSKDSQKPTNIFGWVKLTTLSESKPLLLISIEQLERVTDDLDFAERMLTNKQSLMEIQYVSNHLILRNGQSDIALQHRAYPTFLPMDEWSFFVLCFDQPNKQITIKIVSPDPSKAMLEFSASLQNTFIQSASHIKVSFIVSESTLHRRTACFRDIFYLTEKVYQLENLRLLNLSPDKKYLDLVIQFSDESEVDELKRSYSQKMGNKPIGFRGKHIHIDQNGWPLLDANSELWVSLSKNPANNDSFFFTNTHHFIFQVMDDSANDFVLLSAYQSIESIPFSFRLKLKGSNNRKEWNFALNFAEENQDYLFKHSVSSKTIYSVFLTICIIQNRHATAYLKVNDDLQMFSILLENPLTYRTVKFLDRTNEYRADSIKLYRFLTTDGPTSSVVAALLGLNDHFASPQEFHCEESSNLLASLRPLCLRCNKGWFLNPETKRCELTCPENRLPDIQMCVRRISQTRTLEGDLLLHLHDQQLPLLSTLADNNIMSGNEDLRLPGQYSELALSSNRQIPDSNRSIAGHRITKEKPQAFKNKVKKRHPSHQATEINKNGSSDTNLEGSNSEIISSDKSIIIADNFSMSYLIPDYHSPLIDGHKNARIVAIVTVSVFCLGLLVGLVGCIYPFSLPKESFYFHKVVQTALCYQYICFWNFYDTSVPWLLHEYFHCLYEYSIRIQQALLRYLPNLSKQADAAQSTQTRLFNLSVKGMHPNILGNIALVIIIQTVVLIIVGLITLISGKSAHSLSGLKPNFGNAGLSFASWASQTRWKPIFAVFIMFALEISAFSIFEFMQASFGSPAQIISFILSLLLLLVVTMQIFVLFAETLRSREDLTIGSSLSFASTGVREGFRRLFLPTQLVIYLAMGVMFVIPTLESLTPAIANLGLVAFLFVFSFLRVPDKLYWRNEQMIFHFLLMASNTITFLLQVGSQNSSYSERTSTILAYTAIASVLATVAWNSFILIESLIREIRSAKSRILMQSIFTIKTIATQGIKFRGFDNEQSPTNDLKQPNSKNNLEARLSDRVVCDWANTSYEVDATRNNEDSVLADNGNLVPSRLGDFKYPSKLSKLKDCNFLSHSIIQSGKGLPIVREGDEAEATPLRHSLLMDVKSTDMSRISKLQGLTAMHIDPSKLRQLEKDATLHCVEQTRLSTMIHEPDTSQLFTQTELSQKSIPPQNAVGFNEILTASRLDQLRDSVSFLKRKREKECASEFTCHDSIIPSLNVITRASSINGEGASQMFPKYSHISKVPELYDDDNNTIKEFASTISLTSRLKTNGKLGDLSNQSNRTTEPGH